MCVCVCVCVSLYLSVDYDCNGYPDNSFHYVMTDPNCDIYFKCVGPNLQFGNCTNQPGMAFDEISGTCVQEESLGCLLP